MVFVFYGVLFLRPEAGSRPGGRGTCSLLRQRKVPKRKATHSLRPLRVATGQTCVGAVAGCAVELATRWRAALGQPRRVRSRSMRAPTRMPPRKRPAAGAARWGWAAEQPNSQTAKQPHGPLLRSAQSAQRAALAPGRLRPSAATARMEVRFRVPFRMRRGAQRPADQGSRLSERSEFERDPAGRERRRLPAAKRRDAACRVAFSWLTFFWRGKRK